MRGDIIQFVKFNIVGLLNTLVDMAVFALLNSLGLFYVVAQIISYGAGTANSFVLNSNITFKDRKRSKEEGFDHRQLLRFIILNLVVLGISLLLMSLLIDRLGLQELVSKVLATFVTVIINFSAAENGCSWTRSSPCPFQARWSPEGMRTNVRG